jgi:His-Xaa-Ser system protein HxsD
MTDTAELTYTLEDRAVTFTLDEEIYPRAAIYGASYLFVDKCFVFLTRPGDKQVTVRLRARGTIDQPALEALAGEFGNELLNQVVREQVGQSTQKIREYYMARAFFATDRRPGVDELLAELDKEELEEGQLEIPVPWAAPKAAEAKQEEPVAEAAPEPAQKKKVAAKAKKKPAAKPKKKPAAKKAKKK